MNNQKSIIAIMLSLCILIVGFCFAQQSTKINKVVEQSRVSSQLPPPEQLFPYYQIFYPDSLISGNSRVINKNSTTDTLSFNPNADFFIEDDNINSVHWSNGYYSVITVNNKIVSVIHYLDNNRWIEYFKNN